MQQESLIKTYRRGRGWLQTNSHYCNFICVLS